MSNTAAAIDAINAAKGLDSLGDVAYLLGRIAEVAEGEMSDSEAYGCIKGANPEFLQDLAALIRKHG